LGETKDSAEPPRPAGHGGALQSAANIAVIAAALCVVLVAVQRLRPTVAEPLSTYAVGDRMDALSGVDFTSAPHTLVMAVREDCQYCKDSVPFYQRLTAAARSVGPDQRSGVVVVSTDAEPSISAYLMASDIQVDRIVSVAPGELRLPATPILLVVDRSGVVVRVWRGRLAASKEREVFATLGIAP